MTTTRLIEWIGGKSIFADPLFQARRVSGRVSDEEMRIARETAEGRVYRVKNRTVRRLTPADPKGLSKSYEWGPRADEFVQRVKSEDWDIIRACRSKKEFRDVTDGIPEPSPIITPEPIAVVEERDFKSLTALLKADRSG